MPTAKRYYHETSREIKARTTDVERSIIIIANTGDSFTNE